MSGFPGDKQTYLYAISGSRGLKFGVSHDPRQRALKFKGVLLKVTFGDHREERELLAQMAPFACGNEWFRDCAATRAVIAQWHPPEWLDKSGAWMSSGRLVGLDESILEDEPWRESIPYGFYRIAPWILDLSWRTV